MRIAIQTLGCKVNQSESASIEGVLRSRGYEVVDYKDNPDLCIVNTCTVTAKSDYQSRQLIRRVVKNGARVIATGCYAQLRPHELSGIKGVIYVTGNSGKNHIVDRLEDIYKSKRLELDITRPNSPVKTDLYYSNRARAFLKIQDGCNHSCSYCAVPMARGKSRSLNPQDVLKAVESFCLEGYKEVVLTGVHIGNYGLDLAPRISLTEIIKEIRNTYPQIRLRLSSIEPNELDDDLLSIIADKLICPHLHIPLQSGSDRILSAMNRRYNKTFFRDMINKIISINPDISIGTDVIVGFPGEREKEFHETVELVEELPFSYIHVFPYSKRPGTNAESLQGHLAPKIKKKRVDVIREIAYRKKNDYISRYLDKVLEVIVEASDKTNGFLRAISDNYIKVLLKKEGLRPCSKILVKGISVFNDKLICEPLNNTQK